MNVLGVLCLSWGAGMILSFIFVGDVGALFDALAKIFKTLFLAVRDGFDVLAGAFRRKKKPVLSAQDRLESMTPARNVFENTLVEKVKELGDNDWVEDHVRLFKPMYMETPTLIEWIQRQLETPEETRERHLMLNPDYRLNKMIFDMKTKTRPERREDHSPRVMKARENPRPSLRSQHPDEHLEISAMQEAVDQAVVTAWGVPRPIMLIKNASMTMNEAREFEKRWRRDVKKAAMIHYIDGRVKYLGWSSSLPTIMPAEVDYIKY